MTNNINFDITQIPDLAVISEAAKRLEKAFCNGRGLRMHCGDTELVFEDGNLVNDGRPKHPVFVTCRRKRKRLRSKL